MDTISSIMSYAITRSNISMSMMKNRMEQETAIAQVIMEATQNIEQMTSEHIGSNIDIYV